MNGMWVWQLIILFFLYSCMGWLMEVSLKYVQYRRFINRGFLIGPYCPIYGWGAVVVTVLLSGMIAREGTISEVFWTGYALCGILEYFTSWLMEKLFHARWWDYSQKPMNLNGRIWVGNLLLFGAGSVAIIRWLNPLFFHFIEKLSPFWLRLLAIAIVVLITADSVFSDILMNLVRKEIDAQEGDNTEEISRRVHELLQNRNLCLRIEQAYPDLHTQPYWLTLQVREARKEYKAASHKVSELLKKSKAGRETLLGEASWQERLEQALEMEKSTRKKLRELQKK